MDLRRNKNLLTAIGIPVSAIILATIILLFKKVGDNKEEYFFTRTFVDNLPTFWLEEDTLVVEPQLQNDFHTAINSIKLGDQTCLIFDETSSDSAATYAFYLKKENCSDNSKAERFLIKSLPADTYDNKLKRRLAYSGNFIAYDGYITFTFEHCPWVYIFLSDGRYLTTIYTKDNVQLPKIIRYKDYFFYKRGATFNSNCAAFADKQYAYVLSYRVTRCIKFIHY